MVAEKFNEILNTLGRAESEVINVPGLTPKMKDPIDDNSFRHTYSIENGVDFMFDAQTSKFVEVHIQLKARPGDMQVYSAPPPLGISSTWIEPKPWNFLVHRLVPGPLQHFLYWEKEADVTLSQ
ncbi:MAG: hypothetical protein ACRYF9_16800 [Janthinobacterium lividum]